MTIFELSLDSKTDGSFYARPDTVNANTFERVIFNNVIEKKLYIRIYILNYLRLSCYCRRTNNVLANVSYKANKLL